MSWVEVEVTGYEIGGSYKGMPKTKKQLREWAKSADVAIYFKSISPFNSYNKAPADMQPGDKLTVAGPDPWKDRRWFASIVMNEDRKLVVK